MTALVVTFLLVEDRSLMITIAVSLSVIFAIVLTVGVTTIKFNYFLNSVNHAPEGKVCFTFDDGPHENTQQVLSVLEKHSVKATFFLIGENCEKHPEIVQLIADQGHEIGNHSFHHTNAHGTSSTSKVANEIEKTNQKIQSITGKTPTLYRPPFGVTNPRIARAIKKTSMISIGWSVRSYDTMIKDIEKLVQKVKPQLDKRGHIVLMHDSCEHTAEALDRLIVHCRENGIEIVNLDRIKA